MNSSNNPKGRIIMKVTVIGGTGLIGSKVVLDLEQKGHDALPASPNSGVNTLTGEGLGLAFKGAAVVVDVSNSPSFEDAAVVEFFETSTRHILDQAASAGVGHLVALSVVGTERLPGSGYMRAKVAQENLIKRSSIPYSIVHATQFFEFIGGIEDAATEGGNVRLPSVLFQPVAADDVALTVSEVAVGAPLMGTLEVAGPEQFRFDELVRRDLIARGDPRPVVEDRHARYFGTELDERSLVPDAGARLGGTRYEDWLARSASKAS
ncbi:MAG TPA: SDR family oxidoreductase [Acidimicrobiales bacterium]